VTSWGCASHWRVFLILLTIALLVGGCSSNKKAEVCPRVAALSEAGSLTRFAPGPGRDILDVDFQGEVTDLVAQCDFADAKGARLVAVQLAPVFTLSRGAANTNRKADFTYFVSVVRNEAILSKQLFEVASTFAGNRSRIVVKDDDPPVMIDIPLPYRAAENEYEILVGFQLTAEELQWNQASRGSGR
jgi:hypothetical protein